MNVHASDLKRIFEHPKLLFWSSVVLCVFSAIMLSTTLAVERHDREHFYRKASALTPFQQGQTVRMGAASVTVADASFLPGSGHFAAPAGKQYLVATLIVKNFSDKPINVLPSTDTYVKDVSGHIVYLTPFGLDEPFHAGELLPGEQVRGQVSYLVSKAQQLTFYVDAIWSGGVLPITVTK